MELAWGHAFELLLAALHPGGRLLLGVENFFGLHRLIALRPELTDSDWVVADEYDSSRPAGLARVTARLTGAGLEVTRTYAAYPRPIAPTILLDTEILSAAADPGYAAPWGYLASVLGRSVAPLDEVLADPARLAVGALRHGTVSELAPAWILVAHNVAAGDEPIGGPPGDALPDAVIACEEARIEARRTAQGWTRSHDGESEPVPSGRTLEDLLISACLMRDLPAIPRWSAHGKAAQSRVSPRTRSSSDPTVPSSVSRPPGNQRWRSYRSRGTGGRRLCSPLAGPDGRRRSRGDAGGDGWPRL